VVNYNISRAARTRGGRHGRDTLAEGCRRGSEGGEDHPQAGPAGLQRRTHV